MLFFEFLYYLSFSVNNPGRAGYQRMKYNDLHGGFGQALLNDQKQFVLKQFWENVHSQHR